MRYRNVSNYLYKIWLEWVHWRPVSHWNVTDIFGIEKLMVLKDNKTHLYLFLRLVRRYLPHKWQYALIRHVQSRNLLPSRMLMMQSRTAVVVVVILPLIENEKSFRVLRFSLGKREKLDIE